MKRLILICALSLLNQSAVFCASSSSASGAAAAAKDGAAELAYESEFLSQLAKSDPKEYDDLITKLKNDELLRDIDLASIYVGLNLLTDKYIFLEKAARNDLFQDEKLLRITHALVLGADRRVQLRKMDPALGAIANKLSIDSLGRMIGDLEKAIKELSNNLSDVYDHDLLKELNSKDAFLKNIYKQRQQAINISKLLKKINISDFSQLITNNERYRFF